MKPEVPSLAFRWTWIVASIELRLVATGVRELRIDRGIEIVRPQRVAGVEQLVQPAQGELPELLVEGHHRRGCRLELGESVLAAIGPPDRSHGRRPGLLLHE